MIDNAHNPTTQVTLKKNELYLIYKSLEDALNSDDWPNCEELIEGTLTKIGEKLNKLN